MESADVIKVYKELDVFSHELKPEQVEAIVRVTKGYDQLISLPTGFGKSFCYVLPPLILSKSSGNHKCALIISPLKSLIRDQIKALESNGISAAAIMGEMTAKDRDLIRTGEASLLFATPEAILQEEWRSVIISLAEGGQLCLQAYDEAHCISEWGLDFRPSYRQVRSLVAILPVPVMALTGTITESIQQDIYKCLLLQEETTSVLSRSPNRPNIYISHRSVSEEYESHLSWVLKGLREQGISLPKILVYVPNIRICKEIYHWLSDELDEEGYRDGSYRPDMRMFEMYHSGVDTASRTRIEAVFKEGGNIRILVATMSFGLGVQVEDIRMVVHWGSPTSVLQYWQEVGRCSRDGGQGWAITYRTSRTKYKEGVNMRAVFESPCTRAAIMKSFTVEGKVQPIVGNALSHCHQCCCCAACRSNCSCPKRSIHTGLGYLCK